MLVLYLTRWTDVLDVADVDGGLHGSAYGCSDHHMAMFGVIAGSFRSSYFGSSVQGKSNQCDSVSVAKNLKKVE